MVFIHGGYGNLKGFVYGGKAFYKLIDVHSVTNVLGKIISSIKMWNIVNL